MNTATIALTGFFVWSSVASSTALTPPKDVVVPAEPPTPPTALDAAAIKSLVEDEFGKGHIMVKVARCESQYRQFHNDEVLRGKVNPKDIGIFQINERYHLEIAKKMELDIHTIEGNLAYARHLYDTKGTVPWKWSKPCWGK